MRKLVSAMVAAGALTYAMTWPATAAAESSWPDHPVTVVVTFAPGGNNDLTARILAPALGKALGQSVVVENRAGAGGIIGTQYVQRARPDGYTLLLGTANLSIAPFVYKDVPYDPLRDFVPIGGIQSVPLVLTASKASHITTWAEFAKAAASGKGVGVATPGSGTSNHLALERIKLQTKLNLTHVPYKGSGPAISDVMAGQVESMVDQLNSSLPQIKAGKIQAIAQLGPTRSKMLPDVPTLKEQGVAGIEATTWIGLFAATGTPPDVVAKLDKALQTAMADPEVQKRLDEMGVSRFDMTRDAFTAFVKKDLMNNKEIVEKAQIRSE